MSAQTDLKRVRELAAGEGFKRGPWASFQASMVERLHIHPHHLDYTVGTHSGRMAILALDLFGRQLEDHPAEMLDLLTCCLQHDLAEFITGDIPGTVKWVDTEMERRLERLGETANEEFGWRGVPAFPNNLMRLKVLDLLELAMTCIYEEELGNQHLVRVREKVVDRLEELRKPGNPFQEECCCTTLDVIQSRLAEGAEA